VPLRCSIRTLFRLCKRLLRVNQEVNDHLEFQLGVKLCQASDQVRHLDQLVTIGCLEVLEETCEAHLVPFTHHSEQVCLD